METALALHKIRTILDTGGAAPLRVTGTSMVPFLRHQKDTVILTTFDGIPRTGDILFYLTDQGRPLLHRFHKILPDGRFLICGDHQRRPEYVRPEQVWARVCEIDRNGRRFSADDFRWRSLSRLWIGLYPVRTPLLAVLQMIWEQTHK